MYGVSEPGLLKDQRKRVARRVEAVHLRPRMAFLTSYRSDMRTRPCLTSLMNGSIYDMLMAPLWVDISGWTMCFILPLLEDVYRNNRRGHIAVGAAFVSVCYAHHPVVVGNDSGYRGSWKIKSKLECYWPRRREA